MTWQTTSATIGKFLNHIDPSGFTYIYRLVGIRPEDLESEAKGTHSVPPSGKKLREHSKIELEYSNRYSKCHNHGIGIVLL